MLIAALWTLGLTLLAGLGLSAFYLAERPIRGLVRLGSAAHGAVGATAVVLALLAIRREVSDPGGLGAVSGALLAATLALGVLVAVVQLCRRRMPGLVIAVHASLGVAAIVLLAAYASTLR